MLLERPRLLYSQWCEGPGQTEEPNLAEYIESLRP